MRHSSCHRLLVSFTLLLSRDGLVSATLAPAEPVLCPESINGRTFDYIIVGGGVAGLVLANRLTENANTTVVVLEAGTHAEEISGNWSQVPAYASKFNGGAPAMSWNFSTTPQPGLNNDTHQYFRGKALGGSSAINYMAYAQTAKGAHQAWAYAVNDQSYTYENMLQYYKKTLNYTMQPHATRLENATVEYNPADMSTGGELQVTYPAYTQSWSTWVSKGLAAIGVPEVGAFINGNLLGHTWQLSTIRASDSHRSDSDTAYLRPVMSRPNLSVFQFTMAERIIFENKIAKGVAFTSTAMGCIGTALASKEVILSAGVFQSPQLLQVSGVGPKDLLEKNGIKVVADVPGVGQGMRDHMTIFASYEVDVLTSTALSNAEYLNDAIKEFNENASGPLSSPGGDLVGGEKIPAQLRKGFAAETKEYLSSYPDDWPEILFNVFPGGVSAANGASGKNFATLQATLVAPHSRGTVTIQSSEMSDAPIINPNWLTENSDIDVLVAGFKRVREVLNSSAMAPVLKGGEVFPGPSVETDEDIRAYIARSSSPLYHAFATNRMGNGSDPNAVVDSRGRVVGVSRLRVIDSSSFPFLPPGPAPQIQVYTLAEKLADDIKNTQY